MNKEIVGSVFPEAVKAVEAGKCPRCGRDIKMEEFRDQLSRAEVGISGLCQVCQDDVFEEKEEPNQYPF